MGTRQAYGRSGTTTRVAKADRRHRVSPIAALLVIMTAVLAVGTGVTPFESISPASANVTPVWQNSAVTAVAVGGQHTCAIEDGVLFCWGAGTQGQLGVLPPPRPPVLPPPTDQSKPTRVNPVFNGFQNTGNVTAVAAGGANTCAIELGVLYCWGANGSGQVGNGRNTQQNTPVKVSAANGFTNTNVTAVSAGGVITCAVEGGAVYCWGANGLGGLGDSTTTHRNLPVKVVANDGFQNTNVTAVAGALTTCAIEGGKVYCWGAGSSGQMGNGSLASSNPRPRRVSNGTSGFDNSNGQVRSVSSTAVVVCAVQGPNASSGSMYCWGNGGYGNLGVGSQIVQQATPLKVGVVANGMTNASVSSASAANASCAVDAGIVYCFGINWYGQVGDGTTTQRLSPTKVSSGGGMLNAGAVTMVSAREDHACAIENSRVFCWGNAANGRLGNGETTGTFSSPVAAASLPGAPTITAATVGITTGQVTVSAGPGGVPTSYTVTASATSPNVHTVSCTITAPATTCSFSSANDPANALQASTTYTFTAVARSDQGTSPASNTVTRTTGQVATPTAPIVVPGNQTLQVTVDPTTSGGTPTGYIVYASPGGGTCTILSPATSCNITDDPAGTLIDGTQYTVTTSAFNDGGSSPSSPGTTVTVGAAATPDPPTIVVGNATASATINPTTSGGTPLYYTVTASANGYPTRTCTVTPPATSCELTGLTNGVVYSFTNTATNLVTSPPSAPVTALVDIIPIPATPTVVIDGTGGATISATRLVPGGTPQSYIVTVSANSGGTVSAQTCTLASGVTSCSPFFPGLTLSETYTVTVQAINAIGSATSSAQFLVAAPGPPDITVLSISANPNSVTVSVSPTTSGGPPSSYIVYAGGTSCSITAPATTCSLSGLPAGANTVTASATNPLGTGTNTSGTTVFLEPPGAPDGAPTLSAAPSIAIGNGSASITVASATTGGIPAYYVVTASSTTAPPVVRTCTFSPPATGCTVSGLTNGVTYTFTSSAVNDFGTSPASPPSDPIFVDILPIPNQPTVEVGTGGVTVSATASSAGGTAHEFTMYVEPGTELTCSTNPPTTSSCFIPLSEVGLYTVTVTASNQIGTSGASPTREFRYEGPGAPSLGGLTIGPGQVTVSVLPATDPTTGPASFFTVHVSSTTSATTCTITPPETSCSISGLDPGTYTVTASATNGIGTTPANGTRTANLMPPSPPTAPLVLLDSSTSATVYVGPGNDDEDPPDSYTVTATSSDGGATRTCTVTPPEVSCEMTDLTDGKTYSFTVTATNIIGTSDPGPPTTAILAAPVEPLAPLVTPGDGQVTVTVVPGTGGGPVSVYAVIVEPGGLTCDDATAITPPDVACVVSGLTNGVEYTFTVIAANGIGSSTVSAATTATPRRPPAPVIIVPRPPDRVGGSDRFGTAVALSRQFGVVPAPAAYIASGTVFADALVAGSYAANDGGSVLLVERDRVSSDVLDELRRLKPSEIVIVGGFEAVSESVERSILALGIPVRRVAGADRFMTATALSQAEFPSGAATVYIASGLGFADALPAGVIAALNNGPVLLVRPESIPSETAAELIRLRPSRIVVVGGVNAVGSTVESSLGSYASRVERIGGSDRYATAVALSQSRFSPGVPIVFLASGEVFADALSAVAPAGRLGGPILLTRSTCIPGSVRLELDRLRPTRIVVLGGLAALGGAIDRLAIC